MTETTKTPPDWLYHLYFNEDEFESIFYAGVSKDPHKRFQQHMSDDSNSEKAQLIRHLQHLGIEVKYKKIRVCTQPDDEREYINELENQGHILTNTAPGNHNRRVAKQEEEKTVNIYPENLAGKWDTCLTQKDWKCRKVGSVFIMRKSQPRGIVFNVWVHGKGPQEFLYSPALGRFKIYNALMDEINARL